MLMNAWGKLLGCYIRISRGESCKVKLTRKMLRTVDGIGLLPSDVWQEGTEGIGMEEFVPFFEEVISTVKQAVDYT
jgi:hypothetical protein